MYEKVKLFWLLCLCLALSATMAVPLAAAGSSARGEKIFMENCAVCHGEKGQGRGGPGGWFTGGGGEVTDRIGNSLNSQTFLALATDDFIRATIKKGRTDTPMPAWGEILKDREIDDVIAFIRTWQTVEPIHVSEAEAWGNPASGQRLFSAFCSECHGPDGKGVENFAPSLNNQEFLDVASDDFIRQMMMRGREGTAMRPFKKGDPNAVAEIDDAEIDDIVVFIRRWDKNFKLEPYLMGGTMGGEWPNAVKK